MKATNVTNVTVQGPIDFKPRILDLRLAGIQNAARQIPRGETPEQTRARSYEFFTVVVEAAFDQIGLKHYHSAMSPHAVFQSLAAFHVRYGVPFLFCGDRAGAEYMVHSLLQKHLYEIGKRFDQAKTAMEAFDYE